MWEAHGVNLTQHVHELAPCDWQLYNLTRLEAEQADEAELSDAQVRVRHVA